MTSKEHKKHAAIKRPSYGSFGRQEWAILGTKCSEIKTLADGIIKGIAPYTCAYVDAQHTDEELNLPGRLASGAAMEYTSQAHHHQFNYSKAPSPFQYRQLFSEMDIVLVNGNHFEAKAQVVVIDSNKKDSLHKRLHQLTDVQLFLLNDQEEDIFPFIKEALPSWQQIPVFPISETEKIVQFFNEKLKASQPFLNGLVLAGGQSLRMGQDKGTLHWHGLEQRYYIAGLLKEFLGEVFISCRADQEQEIDNNYKMIKDTFTGLGPYGALLSAFREQPDSAWLVVACDLPMVDRKALHYLVQQRNTSSIATTFQNPQDGLPEPLITIWEPKSYPVLLSCLAQGYTCPRKVLRNNTITMVQPIHAATLFNVNTPEEMEQAKELLRQK